MTQLRPTLKRAVLGILLVSMIGCPLTFAAGVVTVSSEPLTQGPIQFTPDVAPLVTEESPDDFLPGELVLPEAFVTPLPTLGPGQYFERGDPALPALDEDAIEGDSRYGFAQLLEDPSLYLVWMTDDDGTHYMIVRDDSEVLTGGNDPQKGFFYLVRERETTLNNVQIAAASRDTHIGSATNFRWGAIGALVAGGACAVFTAGACLVFVGVAGAAFWASWGQDTNGELEQNNLDGFQDQLADYEGDLRHGFRIGQVTEPTP